MKRTVVICAAALLLAASGIYAFGDIARPKVSPAAKEGKTVLYTSLAVKPDSKAYEARLQISQDALNTIVRLAGNASADQSVTQRLIHSSTRTIMAGLFMFLAVSFAGVWLARSSQRRTPKTIAAAVLVAAFLGAATVIVRANAGPPGYIRWQGLPQALKDGKPTVGGVSIEIVPGDENIKLIVPLRNTIRPGE